MAYSTKAKRCGKIIIELNISVNIDIGEGVSTYFNIKNDSTH